MTDAEDTAVSETIDPEEAFLRIAHEIRVEILLALWRAPGHSLAYSELFEQVDVRDSGQFTYHLSKLVDQFVRHSGERYELLYAGHRVIDAIQSGVFHEQVELDPVSLKSTCLTCGSDLTFEYTGHISTVYCSECETTFLEYPFDPGGVADRTGDELATAFDQRTRHMWRLARTGVCPVCAGTVTAEIVTDTAKPYAIVHDWEYFTADHPLLISLDCQQCSFYNYLPVGAMLLDHLPATCFLHEHGRNVQETPLWRLDFVVASDRIDVQSEEPWRIAVTVAAGDEERRVMIDDTLSIQAIEG